MPLFEVRPNELRVIPATNFRAEGVRERGDLQRLLRDQIEIVAQDTLLLSEEFGEWEDSRRRIDLLALDKGANLVVIELKTEADGGHMDLQALRYAAMVSTMTFDDAVAAHSAYLKRRGQMGEARSRILEFLDWSDPSQGEFANDVRIVLVAPDFSREITAAVMWLNRRDLDVRCVRLQAYRVDERVLVDAHQVIPLPEAEDYQVRLRRKDAEERAVRRAEPTMERFWLNLAAQRPEAEVTIARELHGWLEGLGVMVLPAADGFSQDYRHNGTPNYWFKVRTDGLVAVRFRDLANKEPFSDPVLREELARKLAQIPGVEIGVDRLSGKPRFALSLLGSPAALQQFKESWLWVMDRIRAA